ncbi:hypothetical protein [Mucilaginibacter sp. HD30]
MADLIIRFFFIKKKEEGLRGHSGASQELGTKQAVRRTRLFPQKLGQKITNPQPLSLSVNYPKLTAKFPDD